jgi:tRNA/rRNA methyltransferase
MSIPSLEHIAVILVEPQNPGNIGMVCRAMANFGASDLRLVNPCAHLHPEARKFAVAANHLLGQARLFPDLAAAIADLQLAVATTRRPGQLRGELLDIAAVPGLQAELPPGGRLGLVFGREDAGLTSAEVALCSRAATVATAAEVGSLNLAQAVLLFLHELARAPARPLSQESADPPSAAEMEVLFGQTQPSAHFAASKRNAPP